MIANETTGFPPGAVRTALRVEGLVVMLGAVAAYYALGGSWWLFGLLLLVPDVSMLGMLIGPTAGSRLYNAAHSYVAPGLLAATAWLTGADWLLPFAAIWAAHIGMDRMLGYGLKYPGSFDLTHLGPIGARRKAGGHAHAA
jgi:hypothetical protein